MPIPGEEIPGEEMHISAEPKGLSHVLHIFFMFFKKDITVESLSLQCMYERF